MRKLYFIFSIMLATLLFAACNEEEGAMPPIFGGFRIEPSAIHPGDHIKITAVQVQKGRDLYGARHQWQLIVPIEGEDGPTQVTITYKTPDEEIISSYDDPTWEVTIPANASIGERISGSFKGTWNNASDAEIASFNGGHAEGCIGNINSSCSTLYSQANGSFSQTIQ